MRTKVIFILMLFVALSVNVFPRYYDPSTGKFISADSTTPGSGDNLQGLNRYSYCNNNPVKYVDPTGHEPKKVQEPKIKAPEVEAERDPDRNLANQLIQKEMINKIEQERNKVDSLIYIIFPDYIRGEQDPDRDMPRHPYAPPQIKHLSVKRDSLTDKLDSLTGTNNNQGALPSPQEYRIEVPKKPVPNNNVEYNKINNQILKLQDQNKQYMEDHHEGSNPNIEKKINELQNSLQKFENNSGSDMD